jgi:hypothetical protein
VREPEIIHRIYKDIFPLIKPGGCFLNLDKKYPSLEALLGWLEDAGFENVKSFWQGGSRAIFGGFKSVSGKMSTPAIKKANARIRD